MNDYTKDGSRTKDNKHTLPKEVKTEQENQKPIENRSNRTLNDMEHYKKY